LEVGVIEWTLSVTASAVLFSGGWQIAGSGSADQAKSWMADNQTDEGAATTVSDRVEHVGAESAGRIPVSLRRHAQMYFLHRADEGFEERLRILKEAYASQREVRFTFREHGGRILAVEWTDKTDEARGAEGKR
jgi:hypothetical protein